MSNEATAVSVDVKSTVIARVIVSQTYVHAPAVHRCYIHTPCYRDRLSDARPRARRGPASAGAAAPLPLPHTVERTSTGTHRGRPRSPRQTSRVTSKGRRAATLLSGPRAEEAKSGCWRPAAHRTALAARGKVRLIWACNGVEQAHAVSGWVKGQAWRAAAASRFRHSARTGRSREAKRSRKRRREEGVRGGVLTRAMGITPLLIRMPTLVKCQDRARAPSRPSSGTLSRPPCGTCRNTSTAGVSPKPPTSE